MKKHPILITQKQVLDSLFGVLRPPTSYFLAAIGDDGSEIRLPPEFLVELPERIARTMAARIFGGIKTAKKAAASRANGKKGGRPPT